MAEPVHSQTRALKFDVTSQADIDYWTSNGLLVLMFWADYSAPSRLYRIIFEDYASVCTHPKSYFGSLLADQDNNRVMAIFTKYGIRTIPTTMFIKYGNIVATTTGPINRELLEGLTEQYKVTQ